METSILLARVIGLTLVIIYTGVLLNQRLFHRFWLNISESPVILFLTGFISIILGLLIIQFHNVWELNWRGVITLLGWLTVIAGSLRILFPEFILKLSKRIFEASPLAINLISAIMLVIGLYLTYIGFWSR